MIDEPICPTKPALNAVVPYQAIGSWELVLPLVFFNGGASPAPKGLSEALEMGIFLIHLAYHLYGSHYGEWLQMALFQALEHTNALDFDLNTIRGIMQFQLLKIGNKLNNKSQDAELKSSIEEGMAVAIYIMTQDEALAAWIIRGIDHEGPLIPLAPLHFELQDGQSFSLPLAVSASVLTEELGKWMQGASISVPNHDPSFGLKHPAVKHTLKFLEGSVCLGLGGMALFNSKMVDWADAFTKGSKEHASVKVLKFLTKSNNVYLHSERLKKKFREEGERPDRSRTELPCDEFSLKEDLKNALQYMKPVPAFNPSLKILGWVFSLEGLQEAFLWLQFESAFLSINRLFFDLRGGFTKLTLKQMTLWSDGFKNIIYPIEPLLGLFYFYEGVVRLNALDKAYATAQSFSIDSNLFGLNPSNDFIRALQKNLDQSYQNLDIESQWQEVSMKFLRTLILLALNYILNTKLSFIGVSSDSSQIKAANAILFLGLYSITTIMGSMALIDDFRDWQDSSVHSNEFFEDNLEKIALFQKGELKDDFIEKLSYAYKEEGYRSLTHEEKTHLFAFKMTLDAVEKDADFAIEKIIQSIWDKDTEVLNFLYHVGFDAEMMDHLIGTKDFPEAIPEAKELVSAMLWKH
jgi:hypothetical protein